MAWTDWPHRPGGQVVREAGLRRIGRMAPRMVLGETSVT